MGDHLRSDQWLDVAKHPTITFEALRAANFRTQGAQHQADVTGRLTVKGITREVGLLLLILTRSSAKSAACECAARTR